MLSNPICRSAPKAIAAKWFSTSGINSENYKCKVLIVGGGSGGCTVAAKLQSFVKKEDLIIVEPSNVHYYQPLFTLVGGGVKSLASCGRPMEEVLPKNARWMRDEVREFRPQTNQVVTAKGDQISYEFLLVAMGLQLNYDQIPGLVEGLETANSGVCSNYSPKYVEKTFETLQKFEAGNAIFTFPNTPVKCPGAPQKICYLTEHYLRKHNKRDKATIIYNTSLPVLFGVKKYADALWKIVKERHIQVNLRTNLIEVKPRERQAIFENLDKPGEKTVLKYEMLHATPPMGPPDVLKQSKDLVNAAGFLNVNKDTLQHATFANIFGIGDCTSTPNSKTAASVAPQSKTVLANLKDTMDGKPLASKYNGYASCPLITGYGTCILAEFDYDLTPLETFPISQDKELSIMYTMKKDLMPPLYWQLMLKGHWNGPETLRKILHLSTK